MIRTRCYQPMPDYGAPTHKEVRELIRKNDLTIEAFGELVGAKGRTVRYWCSASKKGRSTRIPYSAWRLALILLEEVEK